jgi:hypothetical protein
LQFLRIDALFVANIVKILWQKVQKEQLPYAVMMGKLN